MRGNRRPTVYDTRDRPLLERHRQLVIATYRQSQSLAGTRWAIPEFRRFTVSTLAVKRFLIEEGVDVPSACKRDVMLRAHERRAAILARRREGATLTQLAGEFGVTRERIRQLLKKAESAHAR